MPAHGELHLRAVDGAGNVQAPHEVVVLDDAPSQARWVEDFMPVSTVRRTGRLEFPGDVDVWGLDVAEAGTHRIRVVAGRVDHRDGCWTRDGVEIAVATDAAPVLTCIPSMG